MRWAICCAAALLALVPADLARAAERAQQVRRYPNQYTSTGLAVDSQGNIWVTHYSDNYVDKIHPNELSWSPANGTQLKRTIVIPFITAPAGIAIDSQDNVYIAAGNSLWKRYPEGTTCGADPNPCLVEVVKPVSNHIETPWAVAVDADDNAYVAGVDKLRHVVWKVTPTEQVSRVIDWIPSIGAGPIWDL